MIESGDPTRRPRVLVWRNQWLPASETFIRNQVDALRGWDAVTGGLVRVDSPLSRPSDLCFSEKPLSANPILGRLNRTCAKGWIQDLLTEVAPDLVHIHFAHDASLIRDEARAAQIPFVVTAHGYDVTSAVAEPGDRGAWQRDDIARTLGEARQVIAVSDFIRQRAVLAGAHSEQTVVHHIGIPLVDSPLMVEPAWDVAFVGRLVEKKGVADLLGALRLLAVRGRQVSAVIVGDGPLKTTLERLALLQGLEVTFRGSLDSSEVRSVLDLSKIFVGPSRTAADGDSEGLGMVFLEAASRGLPVIGYRHGGVAEAVVDGVTGLLAREGDVEQLATLLGDLLDDPARRETLGASGRRRILQDFDISHQTRLLEKIYERCVDR